MKDSAAAIASGDYTRKVEVHGEDEVAALGRALNALGNDLSAFVDKTERTEKIRRDFDRVRPGCAVRAARACNQPAAPTALLHTDDSGADDCGVRPDNGVLHPQLSGQLHLPARDEPARRADCGEFGPREHLRGQRRIRAGHSGEAVAP